MFPRDRADRLPSGKPVPPGSGCHPTAEECPELDGSATVMHPPVTQNEFSNPPRATDSGLLRLSEPWVRFQTALT
jgi:hypothetical protein